MTDRRLLKVLPGGRSSSKPSPDGGTGRRPDPGGPYADPYAIPEGRGAAGPEERAASRPDPGQGARGRARLRLLPPVRDDAERWPPAFSPPALSPAAPPAPAAPRALYPPAADVTSLLPPGGHAPDPASAASQDPTVGHAAGQASQNDAGPYSQNHPGHDSQNHPGHDRQNDPGRGRTTSAGRHRRPLQQNAADSRLLGEREIRVLWIAQLLSSGGDQFARVAIAVLVYGQTRSALLTAVAYALTYFPPLLGGLSVTRLADLVGKLDRRTLMIGLDVARAALVAAMALPGTQLWRLCALLSAAMLLGAPFSAARAALIRDHAPASLRWTAGPSPAIGTIGYQAGQALGFLAGAALVAALQPRRVLLIDALTFLVSACLVTALVRCRRPAHTTALHTVAPHATASHTTASHTTGPHTTGPPAAGPTVSSGAGIVARSTTLRTLALLGWLAGFYVVPECLAAPYARALGGGTLTVGLLMAAMPAGAVLGVLAFGALIRPPVLPQPLGWLAMLSCVPLIFSALHPPLGVVLALWALAGTGTAYQVGAVVAFIRALGLRALGLAGPAEGGSGTGGPAGLPSSARAGQAELSALGFAQAGLVAAQCLGFVAAGAAARAMGPQAAVALAGLCGLAASTGLTRMWRRAHTGRAGACTLARGAPGLGAVSSDSYPF